MGRSELGALIAQNSWVVDRVVRTAGHREHADDLRQEGLLALMRAAESFDPKKGVKFSTYAFTWVKGAVSRYLRHQVRDGEQHVASG